MHCVEDLGPRRSLRRFVAGAVSVSLACVLAGCGLLQKDEPSAAVKPGPAPVAKPAPTTVTTSKGVIKLPPPETPRNWADARQQAARRLVAANPDTTYIGKPPDILLAIPVLSIELNADGSIRHIAVMRYPSQARETVDMAMASVRRAAPFGDVSRLPKPWKFNETFLFNDEKKFKPMTLDQR